MGYPSQVLSGDIRPLAPDMAVAGPAFTVQGGDVVQGESPPAVSSYQMFRELYRGCIIVMATAGHSQSGPWGENTGLTAKMRGASGIVIDGGTRDSNQLVAMGFPTFCRYATPVFAEGRYRMRAYQVPVAVAGHLTLTVTVRPVDFIMGDRDGIVVVPQEMAEEVLLASERLEEIEQKIREELLAGEDREVVYKRNPKFDHVRKAR
jgi:regulator of RNase E activity RraA